LLSFSLLPWLTIGCSAAPAAPEVFETKYTALRAQLLARKDQDQAAGRRMETQDPAEQKRASQECAAIDTANTAWLQQVVATHGWPTRSMVGKDGAFAAWLLVQHADQEPAFQAEVLPTLQQLAEAGEVGKREVAYLTDRVLRAQGKPQIYGTQYSREADGQNGLAYLAPIVIEPEKIDERRAAMGLGPWIEYERLMAKIQKRSVIYDHPRGPAAK
jgi:hypothetical protein